MVTWYPDFCPTGQCMIELTKAGGSVNWNSPAPRTFISGPILVSLEYGKGAPDEQIQTAAITAAEQFTDAVRIPEDATDRAVQLILTGIWSGKVTLFSSSRSASGPWSPVANFTENGMNSFVLMARNLRGELVPQPGEIWYRAGVKENIIFCSHHQSVKNMNALDDTGIFTAILRSSQAKEKARWALKLDFMQNKTVDDDYISETNTTGVIDKEWPGAKFKVDPNGDIIIETGTLHIPPQARQRLSKLVDDESKKIEQVPGISRILLE